MGDCLRLLAIVFFLFFCSNKSYVYGARELADHHHAQEVKSFMPPLTCSPSTNKGVQIADRYGPCSPLGRENINPRTTYREILVQDKYRVRVLNSISPSNDDSGILAELVPGDNNYVVNFGFGTPPRYFPLLFDTGSAKTWIKCDDKQIEGSYNPSLSSTFSNASCSDNSCDDYNQSYHDNSSSSGYYVSDTLTIAGKFNLPQFVFGCGRNNGGDFGGAVGVLGLGLEDGFSLMTQIGDFGKKFCYCLPSGDSKGYVAFGNKAFETCSVDNTIPLASDKGHYYVGLVGITINGEPRLEMPSLKGAIIDSGTEISRLPESIYSKLSNSFRELMLYLYRLTPVKLDPLLDTCYPLESYSENNIPPVRLHFDDNAYLDLELSAVVVKDTKRQLFCLAFAKDDDTIIGYHQLQDIKIYISGSSIGFSTGGCGN